MEFSRIHIHVGERPAELYTYSAATSVRVALLRAGYYVGEGVGTGPKATTTVAFGRIDPAAEHPPARLLGAEWLGRWSRSHSKYPSDVAPDGRQEFEKRITGHPQFGGLA
jgi:queuine tRNA-ribosyltransferase